MYLSHFGLKRKPFQITTDPKFIWLGEKHQEALSTLKYGIMENKGFLLLTGEVGTGKTVLINCLTSQVDFETVIATIPDPDLEPLDFFNFLAAGFHMNRRFETKGDFLIALRNFLLQSNAKNQKVILIIDEAQRLNSRLLEEIRLLSNIELHDKKLINIFFVGQNEFHATLLAKQNKAMAQRITVRYNIEPLTETETGDYITHRLNVAGTTKKIFKSSAIHEIYLFSAGTPRLINVMCDHALLTAYALGKKLIDARIIKECAVELRIPVQHSKDEDRLRETLESIRNEILEGIRLGTIGGVGARAAAGQATEPAAGSVEAELIESVEGINPEPLEAAAAKGANAEAARPLWIKAVYAGVVVFLLVIGGLFLKNYQSTTPQQWDLEDLTSKKMKENLTKEERNIKAELSSGKPSALSPSEIPAVTPETGAMAPDGAASSATSQAADRQPRPSGTGLQGDAVSGPADQKGEAASGSKMDVEQLRALMKTLGDRIIIHFERNSNDIAPASFDTLNRVAEYLVQRPETRLTIKGYTDSRGDPQYNVRISEFRATAVKSYLVAKGAEPANIETFGLGPENPFESNDTPQGRDANRRVELEFDIKGP